MDPDLILNNKPLLPPPLSTHEELHQRLDRVQYDPVEVLNLDVRPTLQLVDTEGLHSLFLNKNPIFQSLIQQLHAWNDRVMDLRLKKIDRIPNDIVYDRLYRSLRNGLIEVVSSKNMSKQNEHLEKVRKWYQDSLGKTQQAQLEKSLENTHAHLSRLMEQAHPLESYQSSLKDFWNKNRSIHKNIAPPEDRVKDYQRRTLLSAVSTTMTRPGTSQQGVATTLFTDADNASSRPKTSQQYRMVEQVQSAKRPRTNQQHARASSNSQSQRAFSSWVVAELNDSSKITVTKRNRGVADRAQSPLKSDKPPDVGPNVEEEEKQEQQQPQPQSIIPEMKVFTDDRQTEQAYTLYDPKNQRDFHPETHGQYYHHDPVRDASKAQMASKLRLHEIYRERRNRELREQREDEELLDRIQEWADNRGRIDEMTRQKGEVLNQGSRFGSVGIKMSEIFSEPKLKAAEQPPSQKSPTPVDEDLEIPELEFDEEAAYQNYIVTTKPKGYEMQSKPLAGGKRIAKSAYLMQDHSNQAKLVVQQPVKNFQEKTIGLEQSLRMDKLNRLKQLRGGYVFGGTEQPDLEQHEIERRKLLSSSSYRRTESQMEFANRPFSGVFKKLGMSKMLADQLVEVEKIKQAIARRPADEESHFEGFDGGKAKNKPMITVRTLQRSIVVPQGFLDPTEVPLPLPGSGLSEMPNFGGKQGSRGVRKGGKKGGKKR